MKKLGIIGYRGMVGSVLMERMHENRDFDQVETTLFSTSMAETHGPMGIIKDAHDLNELAQMDLLISCQGSNYTERVHSKLRAFGYKGYWIDSASLLRGREGALLALDPVNKKSLLEGLDRGVLDFIGANCTVSLLLMALGGLFEVGLVEWLSSMTYQAASGAGAKNLNELFSQIKRCGEVISLKENPLETERKITQFANGAEFPKELFGQSLLGNLLPWIDEDLGTGVAKEEWKGAEEASKLLERKIMLDGLCVRVGSFRCHAQGITLKLKENLPISEIEKIIEDHNNWVKVIPGNREDSLAHLNPMRVSGTLAIPVGRIRKLNLEEGLLGLFTVGDQLLWGAAEPLRRMAKIIIQET